MGSLASCTGGTCPRGATGARACRVSGATTAATCSRWTRAPSPGASSSSQALSPCHGEPTRAVQWGRTGWSSLAGESSTSMGMTTWRRTVRISSRWTLAPGPSSSSTHFRGQPCNPRAWTHTAMRRKQQPATTALVPEAKGGPPHAAHMGWWLWHSRAPPGCCCSVDETTIARAWRSGRYIAAVKTAGSSRTTSVIVHMVPAACNSWQAALILRSQPLK
mmetsp:Transcript_13121/g.39609  ORF Transcript_13121/g.39609 Transcript_13121/m.39609 type:complete len:219 (+) Transcript_13121:818-1474(+)